MTPIGSSTSDILLGGRPRAQMPPSRSSVELLAPNDVEVVGAEGALEIVEPVGRLSVGEGVAGVVVVALQLVDRSGELRRVGRAQPVGGEHAFALDAGGDVAVVVGRRGQGVLHPVLDQLGHVEQVPVAGMYGDVGEVSDELEELVVEVAPGGDDVAAGPTGGSEVGPLQE